VVPLTYKDLAEAQYEGFAKVVPLIYKGYLTFQLASHIGITCSYTRLIY
jgi:hypothetical protein